MMPPTSPNQPDQAPQRGLSWQQWLLLAGLFVAAYGFNLLLPRDLWVQDEARYGEVVREMLAGGNWLVPHLNGMPYPDKPALYFWIVAAVGSVTGQGEWAFRLVSMLSTLLAGVGVYQLGRVIHGRQGGYWAAILFGSALLTLIVGQIVRMDMLLAAATAFAWFCLQRFDAGQQRRWLAGFWVLCALSLAIKGPIALLFTLVPGLLWMGTQRGFAGLVSLRPLLGLLTIVGMVLAWIAAVYLDGQAAYLSTIWHEQLVGRAVNSWSHREPVYFYILLLPLMVMPWVGPVVLGLGSMVRQRVAGWTAVAIFAAVPLVGISLISGKLFIYLEPLVPALCVAGGMAAQRIHGQARVSAWTAWPPALFLLVLGAGLVWASNTHLGGAAAQGVWIGSGLVVLGLAGAIAGRLSGTRWLYASTGIAVVTSWLVMGGLSSVLNPFFSARALGESVARLAPDARPVGVVNATRGILNYYAGRTFTEVGLGEASAWHAAHPDAVLIIKTRDLASVFGETGVPGSCRVHETYSIEFKEYHVVADC
ncbi:ArnT family glycosyltransferase [Thiobacillus sp.]